VIDKMFVILEMGCLRFRVAILAGVAHAVNCVVRPARARASDAIVSPAVQRADKVCDDNR
jgi:hypothetical protein